MQPLQLISFPYESGTKQAPAGLKRSGCWACRRPTQNSCCSARVWSQDAVSKMLGHTTKLGIAFSCSAGYLAGLHAMAVTVDRAATRSLTSLLSCNHRLEAAPCHRHMASNSTPLCKSLPDASKAPQLQWEDRLQLRQATSLEKCYVAKAGKEALSAHAF